MERFRITFAGESLVIGAPEPGVLTLTVCAVGRKDRGGELMEHGCTLSLGGMDSASYTSLDSHCHSLEPGDRVEIGILPDGPFDPPSDPEPMPVPPWAAEDRAEREAAKDEHEPVREAAEELGWTLIEDPAAAGLASSAPLPPPEPPPPAPAIDTSSTNGMERFRVSLRGQSHTIGVPGPGVLSLILCAVVRHHPGLPIEHECTLDLGGLYSSDIHADWPKYHLEAGDRIEIEVLPEGPFDEPAAQRTQAQMSAAYEESKRDYVRSSAKKLGWAVIEGPAPQES